jgi:hypothetical protein
MDGIYAWHPILVGGLVVQSDNAEESIGKTMVEYEVAAKAARAGLLVVSARTRVEQLRKTPSRRPGRPTKI